MLAEMILIKWRTEVEMAAALQGEGKLETLNSTFFKNGI